MVNWTENRLKRVKLLHKEGYSASVIARKLGAAFSKGIVLRKLREFEAERLRRAEMRAVRKAAMARELATKATSKTKHVVAARRPTAPPTAARTMPTPTVLPVKTVSVPNRVTVTPRSTAGVALFDLRAEQCRWPVDEGRPARLFCGSPTVRTTSWCEHHQRLAFAGLGRASRSADHHPSQA